MTSVQVEYVYNSDTMCKALTLDKGDWVEGHYFQIKNDHYILPQDSDSIFDAVQVRSGTICRYTGLKDFFDRKIYENDVTMLEVDGGLRFFQVAIRPVNREVVSHPQFDDPTAKVLIMGVVFIWRDFELFPVVHYVENDKNETGIWDDTQEMSVVGNILTESINGIERRFKETS